MAMAILVAVIVGLSLWGGSLVSRLGSINDSPRPNGGPSPTDF